MKKLLILLIGFTLLSQVTSAQHCSTGINQAISPTPTGIAGFTPDIFHMPCITRLSYVSDTIYFENYDSVLISNSNSAVTYFKIDSITNLPAGLCWSTNQVRNLDSGGHTMAIIISGQCTGPAGQYKLHMKGGLVIGGVLSLANIDPEVTFALFGKSFRYYLRVVNSGDTCPDLDTVSNHGAINSSLSVQGRNVLCHNDTVRIYANMCSGCRVKRWSTGDTTHYYIDVTTPGDYSAVIEVNGDTALKGPITIVRDSTPPSASFVLMPDTSTPHQWFAINQTTGGSGLLSYTWYWGDTVNTVSTGPYAAHQYSQAGYYHIRLTVWDDMGCSSSHIDSSTYIYKTDGQMIGVQVVTNGRTSTGVGAVPDAARVKVYPNPVSNILMIETASGLLPSATIYDDLGRPLRDVNITADQKAIDVRDLPDGIYTLSFTAGAAVSVRFVIAR